MKRLIALLFAVALLLAVTPSLAEAVNLTENASGFNVAIDLPDGAMVSVKTYDDVPYTFITFADATAPQLYISVAPTEEYEGYTIDTLTKDEQEHLFSIISMDYDSPTYSIGQTDAGYPYMLVEDESETDSAMLIILYEGYFVEASFWNPNYDMLVTDDMSLVTALLDTLTFHED